MPVALARKIADELLEWNYEGAVVLSGFGEPLLHPEIVDYVAQFGRGLKLRIEMVTNGDRLSAPLIDALVAAGLSYFSVSMYDGPQQIGPLKEMFAKAGCGDDRYILRDRWHGADQDFGLKLTNRAGTVSAGNQPPLVDGPCQYPAYSMAIDWNGDALLCVQDWNKRLRFGSVATQSLWEIWNSPALHKRRMRLAGGRRIETPCNECNADGCMHGAGHVKAWRAA